MKEVDESNALGEGLSIERYVDLRVRVRVRG